jgi:hypothetical protein
MLPGREPAAIARQEVNMDQSIRMLNEVSYTELKAAVDDFCQKLGITGEVSEVYNLYDAIYAEHERARDYVHSLNIGDE